MVHSILKRYKHQYICTKTWKSRKWIYNGNKYCYWLIYIFNFRSSYFASRPLHSVSEKYCYCRDVSTTCVQLKIGIEVYNLLKPFDTKINCWFHDRINSILLTRLQDTNFWYFIIFTVVTILIFFMS